MFPRFFLGQVITATIERLDVKVEFFIVTFLSTFEQKFSIAEKMFYRFIFAVVLEHIPKQDQFIDTAFYQQIVRWELKIFIQNYFFAKLEWNPGFCDKAIPGFDDLHAAKLWRIRNQNEFKVIVAIEIKAF